MTLMTTPALRTGTAGLVLAAFTLLPVAALAQATAPAAPSEAATGKKELVAKVLRFQQGGVDALARGIAGDTATRVLQAADQGLGRVAPDKREAAGKAIEAEIRKFHGELETHLKDRATKLAPTVIGGALEEKFSEDELREIVRWQESAAVRRYLQLGNELEKTLGDKLVADTRPAVEPRLRNLEGTIRKIIEQPPAGAPAASAPKAAPKAPAKKP